MKFSQGRLPSCQTLAAIGGLALHEHGKVLLDKMVSGNENGFKVTFPKHPDKPIFVTHKEIVSEPVVCTKSATDRAKQAIEKEFSPDTYFWIAYQDRPPHVSGDEVVRVLELAYARYLRTFHPESFGHIPENADLAVYRDDNFHYLSDVSLSDLTGWEVEVLAAGESPSNSSHSYAATTKVKPDLIQLVSNKLQELAEHPSRYVVTACTVGQPNTKTYLDAGGKIIPWHDHIVTSIDCVKQTVNVIDPYNSAITMVLHYADFFEFFYLLSIAMVPANVRS